MTSNDLIKRLIDAGLSFTQMSQAKAEEIAKDLQEAGQLRVDEAQATVQDLMARGRENTMPLLLDCVRAYATLGEMCDALRPVFGEYQEPSEGFAIDPSGSRPAVYSQGGEMSAVERDIWANFWQYANDPAKAREAGIRAAHGEAPSIRLQPDKRYKIELRASGGLSIVPEDMPVKSAT